MTTAAARRIAVPRVRLRRPKPRSRWWKITLAICLLNGAVAVANVALGNVVTASGSTVLCVVCWRKLARWPEASYYGPRETRAESAASLAALVLIFGGAL